MSQRSWFFVHDGQASGPLADTHIRTLLANGSVTASTLVWTDGMTDWGKADEIPELWPNGAVPPPIPTTAESGSAARIDTADGPLAFVGGPWELIGRGLLFVLGMVLVVPAPWAAAGYCRWLVSRLHVPGRPDLVFTGQAGDIWYVFVGLSLIGYTSGIERVWPEYWWVQLALFPLNVGLWWVALRWFASNLSSDNTTLPIAFNGSLPTLVAWHLLYYLSIFTIVGWAWVGNAWTRWMCRHVVGSRRQLEYHATGLQVLWRSVVALLGCLLIIPIPWVMNWYVRWYTSQFTLTGRVVHAAAPLAVTAADRLLSSDHSAG